MSLKSFFKKVFLKTQDKQKHILPLWSPDNKWPVASLSHQSFLQGTTWWSNFHKLCMLEIFVLQNIMVFVACRNSTCFQKLNIIVYFLTCSYSISFVKICDNTFENMRSRDIQIRKCEWSNGAKWPKVNHRFKIVNYFTCMQHFSCRWYRPLEVHLNGYPRISNPYCRNI